MNARRLIAETFKTFSDSQETDQANKASPKAGKEAEVINPLRSFCYESNETQPRERLPVVEIEIVSGCYEGDWRHCAPWRGFSMLLVLRALFVQAFRCGFLPCRFYLRKGDWGINSSIDVSRTMDWEARV